MESQKLSLILGFCQDLLANYKKSLEVGYDDTYLEYFYGFDKGAISVLESVISLCNTSY